MRIPSDLNPSYPPAPYSGQTYYGLPALKHSHYGIKTAIGFFFQSIGSSSQIIAAMADLEDRDKNRDLIRTGRVMALLASPVGPLFFTASLKTPRRFYNMLRILRPTSPMSIGIWSLSTMALFNSLSLAGNLLETSGHPGKGRWMDRLCGTIAAAVGAIVPIYMGAELEETSTPVWDGASPFLPPLFAATGFSNGIAALSLTSLYRDDSMEAWNRLQYPGVVSGAVQLVSIELLSRRLKDSVGLSGNNRKVLAVIRPCILLPFGLRILNIGPRNEVLAVWAELAALTGGFLLFTSFLYGGKESGKVPEDYFRLTSGVGPVRKGKPPARPATVRQKLGTGTVLLGALASAALAFMLSDAQLSRKGVAMGTYDRSEEKLRQAQSRSADSPSGDGESQEPFDRVTRPVRETAQDLVQSLKAETWSALTHGKENIAKQLTGLAQVLRKSGDSFRGEEQPTVAQLAEKGAEQVERISVYLREKDIDEVEHTIKDFARRRPAVFIGAAVAAGFLLARLFRSDSGSLPGKEQITGTSSKPYSEESNH